MAKDIVKNKQVLNEEQLRAVNLAEDTLAKARQAPEGVQRQAPDQNLINELENRAIQGSGLVTSVDPQIQESIRKSIESIREGALANEQALRSKLDREVGFQEEQFGQERDAFRQGGGAFSKAALRMIDETTEKNLRDLEQRKEELILQGNAAAANKIADLEIKALQFQQDAQQREFNNLMAAANIGIQDRAQARLEKAQNNDDRIAMFEIARTAGINVGPTDTLETVIESSLNSPLIEEKNRLELEQIKASIQESRARADRERFELSKSSRIATTEELDYGRLVLGVNFAPGTPVSEIYNSVENSRDIQFNNELKELSSIRNPFLLRNSLENKEVQDTLRQNLGLTRYNNYVEVALSRIEELSKEVDNTLISVDANEVGLNNSPLIEKVFKGIEQTPIPPVVPGSPEGSLPGFPSLGDIQGRGIIEAIFNRLNN